MLRNMARPSRNPAKVRERTHMRDEAAKRERKMRVNRTARHGGRGGGASLSGKSTEGEAISCRWKGWLGMSSCCPASLRSHPQEEDG